MGLQVHVAWVTLVNCSCRSLPEHPASLGRPQNVISLHPMLHSSPNPKVVGASPHAVQIQADMECQVTPALRDGQGICPIPRKCLANFRSSCPLHLCIFLLSAACEAAAIHFYSRSNEFLPYLPSSDLLENSSSFRVKSPPASRLRFLLVPRETSQTQLPGNLPKIGKAHLEGRFERALRE